MYASKYFTEEHMMAYEFQMNDKKDNCHEILKYFTDLYALRKAYYEDRVGKSGLENAVSAKETTIGPRTTYTESIAIPNSADSINTMADTTVE